MQSDAALHALPRASVADRNHLISIELGRLDRPSYGPWRHQWRDPDEQLQLALAGDGQRFLLHFPDLCDFELDLSSRRIIVDRRDLDDTTLEHLLVDQVLPRALAHLGELVIHASAVVINDQAVLFLGESGRGKSTLAGLLQSRGHTLLSDDCLSLLQVDGRWLARPTYPSLRLFQDSLDELFGSDHGIGSPVASYTSKRRVEARSHDGSAPVAGLYSLKDPTSVSSGVLIEPLSSADACMDLVTNAFQLDVGERTSVRRTFSQAVAASASLKAFGLSYARDFAMAPTLVSSLERHFRTWLPE